VLKLPQQQRSMRVKKLRLSLLRQHLAKKLRETVMSLKKKRKAMTEMEKSSTYSSIEMK
jgi:hypothetical protein